MRSPPGRCASCPSTNDDVCLQDGAFSSYRRDHVPGYAERGYDPYVRGYSRGRQRAWLEAELAAARADGEIDWIVVCMHQVAMSSVRLNGADLGIRQEFMPLFDAYGVDLVVAGHEHHYERTFPVRGVLPESRSRCGCACARGGTGPSRPSHAGHGFGVPAHHIAGGRDATHVVQWCL